MPRPMTLPRSGLIAATSAIALMSVLAAGCTPTIEQPPTGPAEVSPTEKGVSGQTATRPAPKSSQAPIGSSQAPSGTLLPDGTINRSGGRPDSNDNGSWEMSVAPPSAPKTQDMCGSQDPICGA